MEVEGITPNPAFSDTHGGLQERGGRLPRECFCHFVIMLLTVGVGGGGAPEGGTPAWGRGSCSGRKGSEGWADPAPGGGPGVQDGGI